MERQRTSKEKDAFGRKCATSGNLSEACKIVCQEQIAACNDDTIQQLRDLHPERSLDLDLQHLPTPAELEDFWESEDGRAITNKWFSLAKIRKYFRTRPALGAADIDGWRGREHVSYLFQNNDHELHQLIIDELIMPYVLGTLHPNLLPEYAGGVLVAFLKPGGGIRPLVIGSIWRR